MIPGIQLQVPENAIMYCTAKYELNYVANWYSVTSARICHSWYSFHVQVLCFAYVLQVLESGSVSALPMCCAF